MITRNGVLVKHEFDQSAAFHEVLAAGVSLAPVGNDKRPTIKWKEYQSKLASVKMLIHWLVSHQAFAAVCGAVSGGLEIIDIDDNAGYPAVEFYDAWRTNPQVAPILARYPFAIQRTQGGGYQVAYRCTEPSGNQKLAWIPDATQEHGRSVAIETRGEGGYAVIAPSVLGENRRYTLLQGSFADLPTISQDERNALIDAARRLCLMPVTTQDMKAAVKEKSAQDAKRYNGSGSVISAYNAAHNIANVLTGFGYTPASYGGRLVRPNGHSPSVHILDADNVAFPWSSNDPLHKPNAKGNPYPVNPFDAFCYFEHGNDTSAAVKAAAQLLGMNTLQRPIFTPQRQNSNDSLEFDLPDYRAEDGGILDCWLDFHGDRWLYITGYESWYQWERSHWVKDERQGIQGQIQALMDVMNRKAHQEVDALVDELSKTEDDDAKDAIKSKIQQFQAYVNATKRTRARVASVEGLAQAQRAAAAGRLDAGNVLNLRNGTLDLDTGALRPHCKDDHLTYCLDYDYDPYAACPQFEQFLSEVLVKGTLDDNGQWVTDDELCALIQAAMGYSLTNSMKHEVMFWLSGIGGNGKSVLIKIIRRLLGDNAFSMNFANLGTTDGNYRLARLVGKRVVFCTESPKNSALAEDIMKQISDGSEIDAREIHGKPFNFKSQAKIWWALNDKPVIKDTGNSVWRRLQLIPFNRTFAKDEQDIHLYDKLEAELSGILNFALDGLIQLKEWGRFPDAQAVQEAVQEYRHESNPVAQWLDECAKDVGVETGGAALYADYERWCIRNGRQPMNSVNFGKELRRLGVSSKRYKEGMRYSLGLLADASHADGTGRVQMM